MAFCASCGAAVEGKFCQKCGTAVDAGAAGGAAAGGGATPGAAPAAASTGLSDNAAGALCYLLGLITGILFLVLAPYNQNRTIRFHAFQSIFLHVGFIILWIVLAILSAAMLTLPVVGFMISTLIHLVMWFGGLILWLYLMFKTYNGAKIVLPIIGPLAEKQAGA